MMIPLSNLLLNDSSESATGMGLVQRVGDGQLDYMKLEWMFDFGDSPTLTILDFWSDTVHGLDCRMSMNEEFEAGSVLIVEWNQNWTHYIQPTFVHHTDTGTGSGGSVKRSSSKRMRKRMR